jgi:hypothetical protein
MRRSYATPQERHINAMERAAGLDQDGSCDPDGLTAKSPHRYEQHELVNRGYPMRMIKRLSVVALLSALALTGVATTASAAPVHPACGHPTPCAQ